MLECLLNVHLTAQFEAKSAEYQSDDLRLVESTETHD